MVDYGRECMAANENDYSERVANGAKALKAGRKAVAADVKALTPPKEPLVAVAYWVNIKDAVNGRDYEAMTAAREAGYDWAEIGAALGTSPENARRRWHYAQHR